MSSFKLFYRTEGQACRVPVLEVNSSEIMSLLKKPSPVICDKNKDWVEVIGSTAKIADWAKKASSDALLKIFMS